MVSAIDRKLLRDLGILKGQVITIALVVASGIAAYVTMQGTYESLRYARDAYYERYRFADIEAHLARAPVSLARRIESLDGVAAVHTRVVKEVNIPMPDLSEPATGQIVSVPGADPLLDGLALRRGRMVEAGRADEAVLLESFALAHHLSPGDRISAVINGTLRRIRIVGIAMSPEYVFPTPVAGMFSDDARFAVLWMDREAVAPAFEMDGAFNDVLVRMQPGASEDAVKRGIERLLEPYGGTGAVGRDRQLSNYILEGEMSQLSIWANVGAAIFLGVAAFLLNVVLSRLVLLQRPQIATLKAIGYADAAIGLHFLELVSVIVSIGALLGVAAGAWAGGEMTEMYTHYFKFPTLTFRLDAGVVATGVIVSLLAGVAGALLAVRSVVRMAPAEAMRPPPPGRYSRSLLDRWGLYAWVSPAARMVLREVERRPLRLMLSCFGIAMAVAIMVVGRYMGDAMDLLMEMQFHEAWREDVMVTFLRPVPERAARGLAHLPGVLRAEGMRAVPVRFRHGHRFRDSMILGYPEHEELRRILGRDQRPRALPAQGVMLTAKLAEVIGVHVGDEVEVEPREGDRRTRLVEVAALVDEPFGMQGHMRLSKLWDLMREEALISMALLRVDPRGYAGIESRLEDMPEVVGVLKKSTVIEQFRQQSAGWMVAMNLIMTILASTIAVGVVYNNARVALSMRSRDLASLRVLGFTRGEISSILLGELAVQVLLAIPVGLLIGTWLCHAMANSIDPEQYRLPVVLSAQTYAYAALVTLAAGLFSALLVRRKLDKLDLIGVLKTRE